MTAVKDLVSPLVLYDVCNDYSLDRLTTLDADSREHVPIDKYEWIRREYGHVGIHREHREIHYYLGADGLTGASIEDEVAELLDNGTAV